MKETHNLYFADAPMNKNPKIRGLLLLIGKSEIISILFHQFLLIDIEQLNRICYFDRKFFTVFWPNPGPNSKPTICSNKI